MLFRITETSTKIPKKTGRRRYFRFYTSLGETDISDCRFISKPRADFICPAHPDHQKSFTPSNSARIYERFGRLKKESAD